MSQPYKMKKVLVTGANGLLGANVVRKLSSIGYLVKAMIRIGSNALSLKGAEYELFEGEITNKEDVFEAVSDCDYVIHSAAQTALAASSLEAFIEINVKATRLIVEACKHFKIKRFVFVSTANCYTNGTIDNPGDETSGFMPWLKGSGYAYSKYLAQQEVLLNVKKHAFPAIIVSPTFLIGPYDAKPSSGTLLLHGYKNRIVFYPPGGKSFIDVEMAAKAICNALTKGRIGVSYLLAGRNMTYKDFFRIVEKQSGQRKIRIQIPYAILSTIGGISSLIEKLFSFSLPLNAVNARLLSLDNYFSNKKAVSELGLEETDVGDAVADAIDWFKRNGFLK